MIDWKTAERDWNLEAGGAREARAGQGRADFTLGRGILRVEAREEQVMRLRYSRGEVFTARPSRSVVPATSTFSEELVPVEGGEGWRVAAGGLELRVALADGSLLVQGRAGAVLESRASFRLGRDSIRLDLALGGEESIYGLGEKTGFLDRRGRRFEMWNTDDPLHTPDKDPLYQSIPFLIRFDGKRATGLFLDSTARSRFDLGFAEAGTLSIEVEDDEADLYVIEGRNLAEVVAAYARLTGTMPLPPRWALGFGQCRWSYWPESKVLDVARKFRARDIPCDSIWLDIDYMDGYRVFTWDRARFPEPAAMCDTLHASGFRVVAIVDPGVKRDAGFPLYVEGAREGRFLSLPDGSVYHGKVWPGDAAYPDFSEKATRGWWASSHGPLLDAGVDGIWNDMNEPSDFSGGDPVDRRGLTPPDPVMAGEEGDPRPFAKSHNAYGFDMCRAAREAFSRHRPGERPFVLTRAGCAGIQRHAAVWTGDNHSWWEHLAASVPMLLGLGLSGVAFCGSDAGGFQGDADAELYARWMEAAALTPFFRAHSYIHSRDHEPWSFGPEAEAAARGAIRLRYSLLPYIYSEMRRASIDGLPVMRPLLLDFEDDPKVRRLDDEFMLGPFILAAPVTRPGLRERLVYLPEGLWYDFHTKAEVEGGRSIIAEAPLNRIPLFVRAGAIIPRAEPGASTASMDFSRLAIEAYAGAEGAFTLYEDDGRSLAYLEGAYRETRFSLSRAADDSGWTLHSRTTHEGVPASAISVERLGQGWAGRGGES